MPKSTPRSKIPNHVTKFIQMTVSNSDKNKKVLEIMSSTQSNRLQTGKTIRFKPPATSTLILAKFIGYCLLVSKYGFQFLYVYLNIKTGDAL